MEEIKNLNDLRRGIHKRWIWENKEYYYRSEDCLQKINYCIHDLNSEIRNLSKATMKEIVFIIVLIDWICEAVDTIFQLLRQDVKQGFIYIDCGNIERATGYFKAVRSFVVAHPLNTSRHKEYGFDGDLICVDVQRKTSAIVKAVSREEEWFHLDFNGREDKAKNKNSDFVLYIYSRKMDDSQFFKYIGLDFVDLFCVAKLYIEKLYALDKYLGTISKKKIEGKK